MLAIAAALVSFAVSAQAAPGDLKHSDKAFIEKAAKSGQAELQISQIAADRATNPQIKEYASMVVNDHQQMNSDLAALAAKKGVTLPATDAKSDKWSKKKTDEFDKDYVKEMTDAHEDAVSLFEKAAKSDDPDVAAFAQKYLPKLQAHYTAAKDFKKTY
jgi:putative membrane protein